MRITIGSRSAGGHLFQSVILWIPSVSAASRVDRAGSGVVAVLLGVDRFVLWLDPLGTLRSQRRRGPFVPGVVAAGWPRGAFRRRARASVAEETRKRYRP